jgi:hypothetical protein
VLVFEKSDTPGQSVIAPPRICRDQIRGGILVDRRGRTAMKEPFISDPSAKPPVLDYGPPEPAMRRLLRRIPRFSVWTWLLSLVVAVSIIWFWNDHDPWVVQRTFPRAFSSLAGNVSPDRRRIIVRDSPFEVESTGRLSICDIDTGEVLHTFGVSDDCRRQIIFSPDGSRLLTLGGWQKLTDSTNGISTTRTLGGPVQPPHLWDMTTGNQIADLDPLAFTGQACFSPDGHRIITLENERATLYDGATGQRLAVLEKLENGMGVGHRAFFSPDSKLVVVGMLGPTPVRIHSTMDGRVTARQATATGFWDSGDKPAALSPDGRNLAFSSGLLLQQIDVSTGKPSAVAVPLSGGRSAYLCAEQYWQCGLGDGFSGDRFRQRPVAGDG